MADQKRYRFLNRDSAMALLGDELGKLDFTVTEVVNPDNAYECAIVRLNSSQDPTDSFVIEFERSWWAGGMNYEDSRITFRRIKSLLGEIDVADLLGKRHSIPLSKLIVEQLCRFLSTQNG